MMENDKQISIESLGIDSIDRTKLKEVTVEDFLGGRISYRGYKTYEERCAKLTSDHREVFNKVWADPNYSYLSEEVDRARICYISYIKQY